MKSIHHVLALWEVGVLPSDAVIAWADAQILALDQPSYDLIELSLNGPEKCLARPVEDFEPRPLTLTFSQKFRVKALSVDLSCDADALRFASWTARNAIGEELDDPVVMLGIHLDHLLDDCDDPAAALEKLRQVLPPMLAACKQVTTEVFGELPDHS